MRKICRFEPIVLGLILIFCNHVRAAEKAHHVRIFGEYGIAPFIGPADINVTAVNVGAPKLTTDLFYGGGVALPIGQRLEWISSYEVHDAVNTTRNTGFELLQNVIWTGLTISITSHERYEVYVGIAGGYPTYAHAIESTGARRDFDAVKQICYLGIAGIALHMGIPLDLFGEIGYQGMAQGTLKDSSGLSLQTTGVSLSPGSDVKMDLSGGRFIAGISVSL